MEKKVVPSILVKTEEEAEARIRLIEQHTDVAQLDVLDHSFVAYRTFYDPAFITKLNPKLKIEVHLMTNVTPADIAMWNVPWVSKVMFHLKAVENHDEIIAAIKDIGKLPGMALNPDTSLIELKPFLPELDTVLIMGVHPGRNGQEIIPSTVDKVRRLRAIAPNHNIEFDGSVNEETATGIVRAGANLLVAGSFLREDTFEKNFAYLQNVLETKGKNLL